MFYIVLYFVANSVCPWLNQPEFHLVGGVALYDAPVEGVIFDSLAGELQASSGLSPCCQIVIKWATRRSLHFCRVIGIASAICFGGFQYTRALV